jgi:hypothetical protein
MPGNLHPGIAKGIRHIGLDALDNLSDNKRMVFPSDKWSVIDAIAARLGVNYFTRRKWFQRGVVPHRWRIPILSESAGRLSPSDFEAER